MDERLMYGRSIRSSSFGRVASILGVLRELRTSESGRAGRREDETRNKDIRQRKMSSEMRHTSR